MDFPTAHALLRDRRTWRGARSGLHIDADGELVLARVPGPADGKAVEMADTLPYERQVSGIAAGPCQALFVADTAHDRLLFIDGRCGARAWLPGHAVPFAGAPGSFKAPRGLACATGALRVADSGHARVQSLAFPGLQAHLALAEGREAVSVAVDAKQRVLLVDAAGKSLHRLSAGGAPDMAFDAAVAASGQLQRPLVVACDAQDRVLVSDAQRNEVLVFDAEGAFAGTLPGASGWLPGAMAAWGTRLYVADAASGAVELFEAGQRLGPVQGWQGPVTAMAVAEDGTLYIKPGLDERFHRFAPDAAHVAQGTLEAGPFDAGEDREWERVFADAVLPPATSQGVEVATASTATGPSAGTVLPATAALLAPFTPPGRRFAWLRLSLASTDAHASPRLRQARLATAAEDYLDYLPPTYRHHDGPEGFLSRWLRLLRGEFGRIEELLDDMPRVADPPFAPPAALAWLGQWLGLELPQIADDAQRRELVARAMRLMARRGTRQSIAQFVALHTGIEPVIVEAFAERRTWVLGQSSRLDFDTRLAPLDPMGMVVPDHAVVGEAGPLAEHQLGLPLYAQEAYRFCVVVDGYRAADPRTVQEITRIVEREKPAHTDWRLEPVAPELRVGLQARIGIDTIVGGDPPPLTLGQARLSANAQLPPPDAARVGETTLDGSLTLT